ncbi:MAG: D-alanine--D-alanine ligase, partial [Oscillospiraceae bacterium]|nr:D-alanine--D-alanine ligase [Oscillospiraceae bacterium]
MQKIKLAVLFGGRATEHDVSVITALQCMDAADAAQYDLIPVYIARDGAWYIGESLRKMDFMRAFKPNAPGITRVYPDLTPGSGALMAVRKGQGLLRGGQDQFVVAARIDAALLAFHGMHGEDGAVQGVLELMNIPYTSSGLVGSAVGMDKIAMRALFRGCGFPVLPDIWFSRDEWEKEPDAIIARAETALPYPMFVKPANLGSSIGISRATDREKLREAIEVALSYDRRVIVERGVDKPIEVNCSVLGFGADVTPSVLEMPVSWQEFLTFDEK